jgi:hypothetical protein
VGCATDLVKSNGMKFRHQEIKDLENCLMILCADQKNLTKKGKLSKELINDWTINTQINNIINSIING